MKKLVLFCVLLSGCATNPFKDYYHDNMEGKPRSVEYFGAAPAQPKLIEGSVPQKDNEDREMFENNFMVMGYSSFTAGPVSQKEAVEQAKLVGADAVTVYSKYLKTVSGSTPLTLPDTQTTYTNVSGNVGNTNYYGSGTSTTTGSKTVYIPYSHDRYEYFATYWIKMPPPIFGVRTVELTPEKRAEIGSNSGALVAVVIKGTPAFKADIFEGDVIRKIGSVSIDTADDVSEKIGSLKGQKVSVELLRSGKTIKKTIQLN